MYLGQDLESFWGLWLAAQALKLTLPRSKPYGTFVPPHLSKRSEKPTGATKLHCQIYTPTFWCGKAIPQALIERHHDHLGFTMPLGVWEDQRVSDPTSGIDTPTPRIPLTLYLTIHQESLGALLAQTKPEDGKERTIYYLSKKFTQSDVNYSMVEKTYITLIWVLHMLSQYTLHHHIQLVTECDPIKYLVKKINLIGKASQVASVVVGIWHKKLGSKVN